MEFIDVQIGVRRLEKGEIIEPTDFYLSTSGSWNPVPMYDIKAPDPDLENAVKYVRPALADKREMDEAPKKKKWPPISHGAKVRVTVGENMAGGWTEETIQDRKGPGVYVQDRKDQGVYEGVIKGHYDSHGLCYDVKFKDGTKSCYDAFEVEEIDGTQEV